MMKNIMLGLVTAMILLSMTFMVSAVSISYEDSQASDYPKVVLKEGGFLGLWSTNVMDLELIDNTDFCDSTCYAILKITMKETKSDVFNEVLFRKEIGNKLSYIPDTFNSEILLLQNITYYNTKDVATDKVVCNEITLPFTSILPDSANLAEDKEYTECHNETKQIQEPYYVEEYRPYNGEKLTPGIYYVKIIGHKSFGEGNIDFVPEVLNTQIEALAWWNSTSRYGNGSDGELVFTSASQSFGNLGPNDYSVDGDILYLNLNRVYQFTSITIGSSKTLSTTNTTGAVLYIMAQNKINISGTVNLTAKLNEGQRNITNFTYLGEMYTTPGVANGGRGGWWNSPGLQSVQGMGYGGGGSIYGTQGIGSYVFEERGGGNGGYPYGTPAPQTYVICPSPNVENYSQGQSPTGYSVGASGSAYCKRNNGITGSATSTGGAGGLTYGATGGNASWTCGPGSGGTCTISIEGAGGSGGIAGKSGIHLVLKSKELDLDGSIITRGTDGGKGGDGGYGYNIFGTIGGGGGGGGGGNAGSIFLYYRTLNNNSVIDYTPGTGGAGGAGGNSGRTATAGSTGTTGNVTYFREGGSFVTLNSPENGSLIVTPPIVTFNATVEAYQTTFTNATFYLWYANGTLSQRQTYVLTGTGIQELIYNVSSNNISDGGYSWNVLACSNDGTLNYCQFADNNNTFTSFSVQFGNSMYNNVTYEMQNQTYSVNVTSTGFVNLTGTLVWDGVEYPAVTTGNNINATFTRSIWIPIGYGQKSFHWHVLYGGQLKESTYQNVTVLDSFFTLCNSTNNVSFININYRDETTNAPINATIVNTIWTYNATNSPYGEQSQYNSPIINGTQVTALQHQFCYTPPSDSIIASSSYQYGNSPAGYSTKIWPFNDLSLSNSSTTYTLFLINLVDSGTTPVTFQAINSQTNIVIGDVRVQVYRTIAGTPTLVDDGFTDTAGTIAYYMSPITSYTVIASNPGCVELTSTITPTSSQYNLLMDCSQSSTAQQYTSQIDGVTYQRTPQDGVTNPGLNTYTYYVNSMLFNMSRVAFQLVDAKDRTILAVNDSLTNTPSCTPSSCTLSLDYTTYTGDNIKGRYFIAINGTTDQDLILIEGDAYWRFIAINQNNSVNAIGRLMVNVETFFNSWGTHTVNCLPYGNEAVCNAVQGCKWATQVVWNNSAPNYNATLAMCVSKDDINKVEFNRIVIIFFFFVVFLFILGRTTGYELNHPGAFVVGMSAVIWILSIYRLFNFAGLTQYDYFNQYIFALTTSCIAGGYAISIIRRYSG